MLGENRQKPLKHFIDCGISVIQTYGDGATKGTWKDRGNFTRSLPGIANAWANGVRRFQLHPYYEGLICIDIDRKGGKDGLKELYDLGVPLPRYLSTGVTTHPAFTVSPSGGYHLYFRQSATTKYRSMEIRPGLEIVHYNHLITVPGSVKDGKPYVFYGDLRQAPSFPANLTGWLKPAERKQPIRLSSIKTGDPKNIALSSVVRAIDNQGEYSPGSSRNHYCYAVAKYARNAGISPDEVRTHLCERLEAPDFPISEINSTINSAYRGKI